MNRFTKMLDDIEADLAARRAAGEPVKTLVIDSINAPVLDQIYTGFKPGELVVVVARGGGSRSKIDLAQLWGRGRGRAGCS